MSDTPTIRITPMTPREAATALDTTIKADPTGYQNLTVWAVFVRRDNGEAGVVTNITDPAMLRAMLTEAAGHISTSPIVVPSLVLPHA